MILYYNNLRNDHDWIYLLQVNLYLLQKIHLILYLDFQILLFRQYHQPKCVVGLKNELDHPHAKIEMDLLYIN